MGWQYMQLAAHCCTAHVPGRACSICQVCVDRVLWCLQRLRDYAALGVKRFSMGVQSFQQEMLAACGRSHTLTEVSAVEVSMVGLAFRRHSIRQMSPSALPGCLHVRHCKRSPAGLLSSLKAVCVSFWATSAPMILVPHS